MKKLLLIILLLLSCEQKKNNHKEILFIAATYFALDCAVDYGSVSPLTDVYTNLFNTYSSTCENIIIGDSTMDYSKGYSFYDASKTQNYGVQGNKACDFIRSLDYVKCTSPKAVLIATADGNGQAGGLSPTVSIKTISSLVGKVRAKFNPTTIAVIGIHPVKLEGVNKTKNEVNAGVSKIEGICYIDPLPIFGVGENDAPPDAFMTDSIHYKEPIYSRYKAKLSSQCGVNL